MSGMNCRHCELKRLPNTVWERTAALRIMKCA